MQNSDKSFEQEAAQQIIYMHDVLGYGFRRISEKLKSQEIHISKDKAWRLYHKYREEIEFKEDDELTQIKKE